MIQIEKMYYDAIRILPDQWPTMEKFFIKGVRNSLMGYRAPEQVSLPVSPGVHNLIKKSIDSIRSIDQGLEGVVLESLVVGEVKKLKNIYAKSMKARGA